MKNSVANILISISTIILFGLKEEMNLEIFVHQIIPIKLILTFRTIN